MYTNCYRTLLQTLIKLTQYNSSLLQSFPIQSLCMLYACNRLYLQLILQCSTRFLQVYQRLVGGEEVLEVGSNKSITLAGSLVGRRVVWLYNSPIQQESQKKNCAKLLENDTFITISFFFLIFLAAKKQMSSWQLCKSWKWYFVTKIVLIYCEKNFLVIEKNI